MKKINLLLSFFLLLSFNLSAQEKMIDESSYNFIKMYIGHGTPFFLELGSETCPSCKVMGKTLYKVSKKHPKYNIRYVNISKNRRVSQKLNISVIPTQIIYNKTGQEVYRHVGKLSENELLEVLKKYKF